MTPDELLRTGTLFNCLTVAEHQSLVEQSQVGQYDEGQILFRAGSPQKAVVFLARGKLSLYRRNPQRDVTLLLGVVEGPSLFGDAECAAGTPWIVSARADEPCACVLIPNAQFVAVVDQNGELARRLYRDACVRHLLANYTAQTLALYDVETRLMRLLLDFAYRFGERDGDSAVIARRISRVDLAAALGVSRKTITRALLPLERNGALGHTPEGHLVVYHLDALEARLPRDLFGLSSRYGEELQPVLRRWKSGTKALAQPDRPDDPARRSR